MLEASSSSQWPLAIALGIVVLGPAEALAQTEKLTPQRTSAAPSLSQQDWSFWPPEKDRAPRTTHSGSSRNLNCTSNDLIPLTPHEQVGLTSQARPHILLYVLAETPRQAIFAIQSDNHFYHTVPITLPAATGIVSLPLPSEIPDLAADTQYQWSLVFICHDELRPDSPVLSRWLDTQTTLTETLLPVSPSLEQAARYRDDGLWYDMIAMLAELKIRHPDDVAIQQAWLSVLERHQLEALADVPLVHSAACILPRSRCFD